MQNDLIRYYHERASEYEKIYQKPERQEDILQSAAILQDFFRNREVLEIACGTGFWTAFIARTAASVWATDINSAVVEIARRKKILKVVFEVQDFYTLNPGRKFQSLFGGFILSHIPVQNLADFFRTLNGLVKQDGTIVLMDNRYVAGSNHPVTRTDAFGNTCQTRRLDNGATYEVLKNFATEAELKERLKPFGGEIEFILLSYFWILRYKPV